MLLAEWFAWWREIPVIRADEHLDAYMVHLLGDPGWTLDRESVLHAWRKVARRESNGYVVSGNVNGGSTDDDGPGALRRQAHRVRDWLRLFYGEGVA